MKPLISTLLLASVSRVLLAAEPVILADTNRDGVVDVSGASDRMEKTIWTDARGAILLPNIGDSAHRCPATSAAGVSDAQLEACNDAQGNEPRAPEYFAPLRTVPMPDVDDKAVGHVAAVGQGSANVRIFVRRGQAWEFLAPRAPLTALELRQGVQLGVDSRDVVRDSRVWDGRVAIEFTLDERGQSRRDRVAMRVAPVLTHHHVQRAEQVLAPLSGAFIAHQQFVRDLEGALAKTGFANPLRRLNTTDVWAQDVVEFGYVSMPRPGGALATLRIAIRSAQPGRAGGRAVFDLRGPGMGAIQIGGDDYHQADSFGNLETIPPYEFRGARYPAGRIIYGDVGDGLAPHRDMMRFFESQEAQAPIVLDTSWLVIGHVDEFVQFLPADTPRGWKIAVVDVGRALDVLRAAQQRGQGDIAVYSRPGAPKLTISQLLADASFLRHNELARRKIELNIGILKAATGVRDDEIVRVPGLYRESEILAATRRDRPGNAAPSAPPLGLPAGVVFPREKIVYGPGVLAAFYPGAINGIVIDARNYIAPKAWGPLEHGTDILQQAVDAAYREAGFTVWSIDDWDSHHRIGGEVHCGTNTIRAVDSPWW